MSSHALLSPSSAHRWMRCTGSLAAIGALPLPLVKPDDTNEYAMEGTAAHILADRALRQERNAEDFRGPEMIAVEDGQGGYKLYDVDDEMIENVQAYLDQVRREPGELMAEQKLSMVPVFGVEDQFGTADTVVLDYENARLYVGDLKYGRGVQVFAKDNEQLYSYAAAAFCEFDMLCEWQTITVAIHQPRLNHYDEHTLTRAELLEFIEFAKKQAQEAFGLMSEPMEVVEQHFFPGEKQCQWCPRKGACGALAAWSHEQVFQDFEALDADPGATREPGEMTAEELAAVWRRRDTIAGWLSEVQAEAKRRLEAGMPLPGLKLVQGRAGARRWVDPEDAEARLKKARLKQADMYSMKVISPTQAEKLLKKSKPRVWSALQEHITQAPGAPAVAPVDDKRPALEVATEDQFADESDEALEAMFG